MKKGPSPTQRDAGLGIRSTYREYFLQYASYVITDRAIPSAEDGLKPVQRRILHSLWENEDGRYNKVANLVGHTMKYHPHGDASIYSALVGMGQKELLIDTQGNWGNPLTGDSAAAARYIEARLSKFAKEVVFAPQLTQIQLSYDGRNKEPVLLPIRFPLLLATGAEGIAVGMTTRVLPHNFVELLEGQISTLQGKETEIYPDFPTGGTADVSGYSDGGSGSRVKVRALIETGPGKTLIIREVPFGVTTESLIDSILAANEKGKIKIVKVEDNSAAKVEVVVTFHRGADLEQAIDALFAFTSCEVTLTSNPIVIRNGHPIVVTISELQRQSAKLTRSLLKKDLKYKRDKLYLQWHRKSLVRLFIEHHIYLRIEACKTWAAILHAIDHGLEPHKSELRQKVTEEDIVYLTEVKIRRISAWDANRATQELSVIDTELEAIRRNLRRLTAYTIDYFEHLIASHGSGRERRTKLKSFTTVRAAAVAAKTEKLYVDRKTGFIGTTPKLGEEISPCSTIDDVFVVLRDGGMIVTQISNRKYIGENILYIKIFEYPDKDITFNTVWMDIATGRSFVKRFKVGGTTRDRRYELGKGKKGCKILFFQPGGSLFGHAKVRKKPRIKTEHYIDFDDYPVKGRGAKGVTLSRHRLSSVREISERIYRDRCQKENQTGIEVPQPESPSKPTSLFPKNG